MTDNLHEFDVITNNEIGERLEHPESVCLVSTTSMKTWEKDSGDETNPEQVRGNLAIESIKMALGKGFRVVIVDDGSSEDFVSRINEIAEEVRSEKEENSDIKISNLIVEPEMDMGYSGSRRQALKLAENLRNEGVKAIVMMEIEKTGITQNVEKLVKPIIEGKADVVIPERGIKVNLSKKDPRIEEEGEDFRGYPPYQAYSEVWSNKMLDRLLVSAKLKSSEDPVLDLFGGTRVIANDPEILEDFYQKHIVEAGDGKTNPKKYFDAAYAPIAYLMTKNRKVVSVPIDYHHPEEQSKTEIGADSFDMKRDSQRNMITSEMARQTNFIGELKRYIAIEMKRFPYEMKSGGFGIEKISDVNNTEFVFQAEAPAVNASYELLKLARAEGKVGDDLIEYEGRTILEALLDQKFRLCGLNREDISHDSVIDEKIKSFVGSENSVFVIRKAMSDIDVKREGLEVSSWGRVYFSKNSWIFAIDEGSELDAAFLVVNDMLEDYQISMKICIIPYKDYVETGSGSGLFSRVFRK